jgi:murein DD-endopeptidase MepM/ murein hydrolase activator NlpD
MLHPLKKKFPVSSPYGQRNIKVGSKNHGGIDIAAPSGSPVYAPLDGKVVRAEDTTPDGCGGHVRIRHNRKLETKFCHLKKWVVKRGQRVKKGDVIGYSGGGRTDKFRGTSTGSHLHYEIVVDGISKNPVTIQKDLV